MIPNGAVKNSDGQVAMRYMQQHPAYVKCNGNEYVFQVRANIAIAYVEPEDVDCLLGFRKGCGGCGGKKKNVIFLADAVHATRWNDGGGSGR